MQLHFPHSKLFIIALLGTVSFLVFRPVCHVLTAILSDKNEIQALPFGYADDASRLNQTKVCEIWSVPASSSDAEDQLAKLLEKARTENRRVAIAGAGHSMGGHTIYPEGIIINMLPFNRLELNQQKKILTAQAGATWEDIIAYLDPHGLSVQVMQSNNSFSLGGSISANCHGWQYGHAPIASTVESVRIMLADGSILNCSRIHHPELFSLALGGYGLFGIILDVKIRVTENSRYRVERHVVPTKDALLTFDKEFRSKDGIQMVYARMNIARDAFLEEVILNGFSQETGPVPLVADRSGGTRLKRAIFRGSAKNDYGKKLRWMLETKYQPLMEEEVFSRNQLLNESVNIFQNQSETTTDILHEYFIPREHALEFISALKEIIPRHEANLLNITVRSVREDTDTFLRYADQPMITFVMLFVQERTLKAEAHMEALTKELIDAAIEREGRYYLPYRLHATPDQFHAAYPQARDFFRLKSKYDPNELFQNQFFIKYGKQLNNVNADRAR